MSNLGICFVAADEAGLIFTINTDKGETIERRVDTVHDGVYFYSVYGVASNVYLSSSMDFASEYGFETDQGARDMLNAINADYDEYCFESMEF